MNVVFTHWASASALAEDPWRILSTAHNHFCQMVCHRIALISQWRCAPLHFYSGPCCIRWHFEVHSWLMNRGPGSWRITLPSLRLSPQWRTTCWWIDTVSNRHESALLKLIVLRALQVLLLVLMLEWIADWDSALTKWRLFLLLGNLTF